MLVFRPRAQVPRLVEGLADDVVEVRVHLVLLPEVLLQALHPLEVRDDNAAGIREHVREDEHAAVLEDVVGGRGRGPVRTLDDDRRLDLVRVVRGDHLLERARREDVAVEHDELLVRQRLRALEACQRARLLLEGDRSRYVDPVRVVDAARRIRHRDHLGTVLVREEGEVAADVAETLDSHTHSRQRLVKAVECLEQREQPSARGRFQAAQRAADCERLARHDAEHRVALVHGVRVEDPRHLPRPRAHVRGGNVLLGADLRDDLGGEPAGHPLELAVGHVLRVADDTSLRAAERNAHEGALPRHPHRQRLHLVERDVRVVADPALRRASRDVVRDAKPLERLDGAVVQSRRNRHGDGLLALGENVDEVRVDVERLPYEAKLLLGQLEGVLPKVSYRCV